MRASILGLILAFWTPNLAAALELVSTAMPDDVPERLAPFYGGRYRTADGRLVDLIRIPGKRPVPGREPVAPAKLTRSAKVISGVPAFVWTYGCTPTVAGMLCGMLDREGYASIYTGSVNGGVCPLSNAAWGGTGADGECSFVASHQGIDGRATRGHVDDYYEEFKAEGDPYYGNWEPHNVPGGGDCLADFMGTSQYYPAFDLYPDDPEKRAELQQPDGYTLCYFGSAKQPYTHGEFGDAIYGLRLFLESRGYAVESYFSQYIDSATPERDVGFTFADYKAEIDAGRPVLLHVDGHSMLGIGYDEATQTVYHHDTWDYLLHEMTWGGLYDNGEHYGVSVVRVAPAGTVPGDSYSGGSGTEADPYLIATKQDLLDLRATTADYHRHFRLAADIDLDGEVFADALLAADPDHTNTTFDGIAFSGTFDGGGFAIRNLTIDTGGKTRKYLGLFGLVEGAGREVVANLRIENASITAASRATAVGGVCGHLWYGTIRDCQVNATVSGGSDSEWIGGLCGISEGGEIRNCNVTGTVQVGTMSTAVGGLCGTNWEGVLADCSATGSVAGGEGTKYIGGLCGENTAAYTRDAIAVIEYCQADVDVSASGSSPAGDHSISMGGLCGGNYASYIGRSYATGTVTATNQDFWSAGGLCGSDILGVIEFCDATGVVQADWGAGGLCGSERGGEIFGCSASGAVTGGIQAGYLGGLCGWLDYGGTIRSSRATGPVTAGDYAYFLGGLCGVNGDDEDSSASSILDCYARGSVTGGVGASKVGGLCGMNTATGTIQRCYATGQVIGSDLVGGFCGDDDGTVAACFWDTESSGTAASAGAGAVGRTTSQMQTQGTFTAADWDFAPDTGWWKMVGDVPGYPVLYWEPDLWTLALVTGWNLVSLPLEPIDPRIEAILGGEGGRDGDILGAQRWNASLGSYEPVAELHACVGYWIYAREPAQIPIAGRAVGLDQWSLAAGWNLLGTNNAAHLVPDKAIVPGIYRWNPATLRYEIPRGTLAVGVGYWIRAETAGDVPLRTTDR